MIEEKQLQKIEGWFNQLNQKVEREINLLDQKINNRFDAVMTVCSNLGQKIEGVDNKVDNLNQKVESLDQKVENLDAKVENLDQKVENLDAKVENLDQKVENLDAKVDNHFATLMKICSHIRQDINELRAEIKIIKEINDKYDARISVIELALKELERRFSH